MPSTLYETVIDWLQYHLNQLDKNGIIKPGEKVLPGEYLVAYVEPRDLTGTEQLFKNMNRSKYKPYVNKSLEWDKSHAGIVKYVTQNGKNLIFHVSVENELDIGDKLSGNYGNKGIVTKIIKDEEGDTDEFNSQNSFLFVGKIIKYSDEQKEKLEKLGFEINLEYDCFEYNLD